MVYICVAFAQVQPEEEELEDYYTIKGVHGRDELKRLREQSTNKLEMVTKIMENRSLQKSGRMMTECSLPLREDLRFVKSEVNTYRREY